MSSDTLTPAMGTATTPGSMVLLTRLAREVFQRSTDEILGMRLKEYMLLCDLRDREGAMAQQALCGTMHLDPNNLVLMLNEVEKAGFVERRRDPEDRRRHIVELTAAGQRALVRAERGMQSVEDEVLSALSQKERVDLGKALAKALRELEFGGLPSEGPASDQPAAAAAARS
jgi:DNA-binding MarR family transcriptional regulator